MNNNTMPELLDMDQIRIDPACALKVPAPLAMRCQVLPFAAVDGEVYVACIDPKDRSALQAVERAVHLPICAKTAEPKSLRRALNRLFGDGAANPSLPSLPHNRPADLRKAAEADSEDAVALCTELLHAAIVRQASDIHIDPSKENVRVRFRVDGALEDYRRIPTVAQGGLISRFKVLSGMDIAEKRAPQDGRFTHEFGPTDQTVDVRVATLPTKHGERMTLRLLALQTGALTLEKLGMSRRDLDCFSEAIEKPHGLVLLTGPTGSGKSTTLYAAIRRLISHRDLNVITIEDPIEYDIDGVAQVEIDSADKVSFPKALRSVLRHDPDVVMIGEIRDAETADIAIKAALTGHLVFSTLHTNSAPSAITRLIDMGVARYLVAATIRLAVAQRLVRRACSHCRQAHELTEEEALLLCNPDLAGQTVYEPKGCMYCANKGYVGRLGLFEMVSMDEGMSRQIAGGASEPEIVKELRHHKIPRLTGDALEKLSTGDTTLAEVLRAVTAW